MSNVEDLTLVILQQIRGDLRDVRGDVQQLRTEMNERFEATNQRVDGVEQRLGTRIDETNRHLEGMAAQQRLLTRYVANTMTEHEHQIAEVRELAHKHER